MVNLMSVDAQRLMDILTYLNLIWSSPYQIILAIYFLYRAMGISVLAGVAVMLVIFPLNFFIGRWLRNFQVDILLGINPFGFVPVNNFVGFIPEIIPFGCIPVNIYAGCIMAGSVLVRRLFFG